MIAAARSAPERGEELVEALAQRVGVPSDRIRIAIGYYTEYANEVDQFISFVEDEAAQLERALQPERYAGPGCD